MFGVLPLFHIFGLNVVLGLTLAAGGTVVLVQRFDPSTALDTIRDRGVTVIPGAPPMWVAWTQFLEADPLVASPTSASRSLVPPRCPRKWRATFEARFGLPLREGYGLTEASPVVTSSVGVEPRIGTIGVPLPGVTIRLVDESGDDALDGDSGEIWVKGPNVFAGYWDDAEATARALTPDGWLRTGDIAIVDDGYLSLVDRAKDLIIVSGFNVYPAEVEDVLAEAPGVRRGRRRRRAPPAHGRGGQGVRRRRARREHRRGATDRVLPVSTWPATSARPRSCSSTRYRTGSAANCCAANSANPSPGRS